MRKLWAYIDDCRAISAVETAILFPILISLMMGIYDLGQGVIVNQKTVTASQVIADLVGRNEVVDMALLTDIRNAGELALMPYSNQEFGTDMISVEFDIDQNPVILWRVTENMTEDDSALDTTDGLGQQGNGVVIISVINRYEPFFSNFIVPEINMAERAYVTGRISPTIICTDCP